MKRALLIALVLALCFTGVAKADEVRRIWYATSLTGGAAGALDGVVSGVSINAYDGAVVVMSGSVYIYGVAMTGAVENSPYIVTPDDVGASNTRWQLVNMFAKGIDYKSGATLPLTDYVLAGTSTYYIYSGVTVTQEMLGGGMLYIHTPLTGSTPTVIGIPAISGSTGFFMVKDMTGGGVTVQTTSGEVMYSDSDSGTAYWVNLGNSRSSATFKMNTESGTCKYVDVIGEVGNGWLMN